MTQAPSIKEALERSIVAIDDWLNVYASELCNQDRVDEANHRISNAGGTLAYIANVQQQNRAALATLQPSGERREAIAETMWRAELRRAAGKERSIPWSEVATCDQEMFRYVADAILASGLVQDEAGIRADEPTPDAPDDPREAFAYFVSKCAEGLGKELMESGQTETQARNQIIHHLLDFAAGEACRVAREEHRSPDREKWTEAVDGAFARAFKRTAAIRSARDGGDET